MKFSWKIFFITFLIIITSFGVGGFLLINTVFTNTLNNRIDSAKKNNNYITTALSVYADNNQPTYGNLEYLRVSAIGFAKQIAGNSDSKIKIGSINELSFSAENEFAHGMSVNSRKSRIVTENKKYYIQTISKIQLVTASCYIETVDDITSVYSDRDMYCTIYQFILIGVALFASILLVIFSKLLTRPLVKLKDASKEVAEGNFNMRVKESHGITSSTEITELSQSFNTMADYVEDYIEQLKLATQNRDNFIADFTHELKTPLTSISGFAEIIMNGIAKPEDVRHFAENIYNESARLITLVGDIIKISQLDEGLVGAEKTDVDLLEIARKTANSLQSVASKNDITISVAGESSCVKGVYDIIDEMVYNLCDNAVKYNRPGGSVNITVENKTITVADTGIGIPLSSQPRVFERFYRVDKSHSKEIGGTGLGLSIVKHAAIYHGAKIDLESVENVGTKIKISF